jgi:hypothetical protein
MGIVSGERELVADISELQRGGFGSMPLVNLLFGATLTGWMPRLAGRFLSKARGISDGIAERCFLDRRE